MPADPTLEMRRGLPSDFAAMVDISITAFSSIPIGRIFFPPNEPSTHKFWTDTPTEEIHDPNSHFHVITDPFSSAADTPIAFAKWTAPLPPGTPIPPLPEESARPANQALAARFLQTLTEMHEQIMSGGTKSNNPPSPRPHRARTGISRSW